MPVPIQAHPYTARVARIETLCPSVKAIHLDLTGDVPFTFLPGQFISIPAPLPDLGANNVRSYSIASYPDGAQRAELAVTHVKGGPVSSWLHGLRVGTEMQVSGPYGMFTLERPPDNFVCFVATGTGITPIRPMLRRVFEVGTPHEVMLIFGCRFPYDVIYRDEFEAMAARHANFRFVPTLSRPDAAWQGHSGYVQVQVDRYLVDPRRLDADVYVCGLTKMVNDVRARLRGAGWDRKKIHYERYD